MFENTTGYWNTAQGVYSLTSNTSGMNNTAIGVHSLHYNSGQRYFYYVCLLSIAWVYLFKMSISLNISILESLLWLCAGCWWLPGSKAIRTNTQPAGDRPMWLKIFLEHRQGLNFFFGFCYNITQPYGDVAENVKFYFSLFPDSMLVVVIATQKSHPHEHTTTA